MSFSNKRVLVTGATGLIGKELAEPLLAAGFDVYAITIDEVNPDNGFHWIHGSLFDSAFVRATVEQIRPTHLLNLAWVTTGDYLTNSVNYSFLSAGINLACQFSRNGGKRAVFAGTCFEYQFKDDPIVETDALDPGRNVYTFCKTHLREIAENIFQKSNVSFAYGRIFNAYGRGEPASRLTGMIIEKLRRGEEMVIRAGPLVKDYVYSKDIANAFVALLETSVDGPVNIATGKPVTIRDFAITLARCLGREELLVFRDDCSDQPLFVTADVARLTREVGYLPQYDIERACMEICG